MELEGKSIEQPKLNQAGRLLSYPAGVKGLPRVCQPAAAKGMVEVGYSRLPVGPSVHRTFLA